MSLKVSFAHHVPGKSDRHFENFPHLREQLRSIWFSPSYRMRSHSNEFGRTISRELLAVADDGRETYLGSMELQGDKQ